MSSLIKGYEYDIFISYRQKDNKADYWVTHFVEALKDELEATFKEDISVYFDENTLDGLLETHDVDQSLKEKIKVLVFIPIISHTYCDPKSFAWQQEFIAFRDFASNDDLGLDQKLASGNVCKRILPVKIHDIDKADERLYIKETSGVMRSIDFIYKASGVNRPLRANEEHPDNNLNGTIYRDQINKVANAIKEIITVLKSPQLSNEHGPKAKIAISSSPKRKPLKVVISVALAIALILSGYFIFVHKSIVLKRQYQDERIAIIPFTNNTNDPDLDILGFMAADWIIKGLMDFDQIKVVSYATITRNMAASPAGNKGQLIKLAGKMGADKLIMGSYYQQGNDLSFQTQLLDVKTGEVEVVLPIVKGTEDNIGLLVQDLNQRVMTIYGEAESAYAKQILKNPPKYEAYKEFHRGLQFFGVEYDLCREFMSKAIALDSSFFWPYFFMSVTYDNQENILARDNIITLAHEHCKPYSNFQNICLNWLFAPNRKVAYQYAKKMYEKDPQNHFANLVVGQMAKYLNRPNEAIEYFKELDYSSFRFHSPLEIWWFRDYAYCLIRINEQEAAKKILTEVPLTYYNADLIGLSTWIYVRQNKPDKLNELIQQLKSQGKESKLIAEAYLSAAEWFGLVGNIEAQKVWAQMALELQQSENDPDTTKLLRGYYYSGQFKKVLEVQPENSIDDSQIAMIAISFLETGAEMEAKRIIKRLEEQGSPVDLYQIACYYAVTGQRTQALKYLKGAFENDYVFTIRRYDSDLLFASLRDDPEFKEFIAPKDF